MEREHRQQPEQKNINLEKYGYNDKAHTQSKRLQDILKKGKKQIAIESDEIFCPTLTAVITQTKQRKEVGKWTTGESEPSDAATVRLGIGLDFIYQMRKERYKSDDMALSLFLGQKAQFNDRAMAIILRIVDEKDLALVHKAFDEIIEAERHSIFYSAQTIYPGLEKYFLPKSESTKPTEVFKNRRKLQKDI